MGGQEQARQLGRQGSWQRFEEGVSNVLTSFIVLKKVV
jgi:hypothetical protein